MSTDLLLPEQGHQPAPASEGGGSEGPSIQQIIAQVMRLVRRYFWVFIITCSIGGAAAYFWAERQPRIYEAHGKMLFPSVGTSVFGKQIERVELLERGDRYQFKSFWSTQEEILRSSDFAERVARQAGLLDDEAIVPRVDADGRAYTPDERESMAAAIAQGAVSVSLIPETRVVEVTSTGRDPELVARLANAYMEAYVAYTREFQSGGLSQMVTWFDDYVAGKRAELDEAQRNLQRYKKDKNILTLSYESQQNLTGSSMTTINERLSAIIGQLAAEQAKLAQIEAMEREGADLRALADMLERDRLLDATQREAALREQIARLRGRGYLEDNPEIRAATSELEVVRENIEDEIARIKTGIAARVSAIKRERDQLRAEVTRLKQEAFELDELGVEYSQLRDNADNLNELFKTVLKRSEELDINSMYESETVKVLEEARAPGAPISPNVSMLLSAGLLLGFAAGAGILALIYLLDNTVRSEKDIARYTDRPLLGSLPSVNQSVLDGLKREGGSALDIMTHIAPRSTFAEGIKSLRTNLMFISPDAPPRLLLVTSPGPAEGKTMVSTNMAVAMAQSGLRTVIVDSDMRRPRVHKALGLEDRDVGLSSLITNKATIEEAVQPTEIENLDVIPCGPIPPNPSELLHTESFKGVVERLAERYDRVIFDSPPLGAVADALVLSHSIDAVLLVTRFGQTRRELLRRAIEQLETVGAPLMGCVLNNIDTSAGGYGYNYYYYYRYDYDEKREGAPKRRRGRREDAA